LKEEMEKAPSTYTFETLADPLNDRVMKDVPKPPHRPLGITQIYP
jgi:hypothetical protein